MSIANRPERATVEAVFRQEARRGGMSMTEIMTSREARAVAARRRALVRIKRETGCSSYGLATVVGIDHGAVIDAVRMTADLQPASDPSHTVERLAWAHGPHRAAAIVAGEDPATEADLAAWRGLGRPRYPHPLSTA